MAWDEGPTLAARFEHATDIGTVLHRHWRLGSSYGGFSAALVRQTPEVLRGVVSRLQRLSRTAAGSWWHRQGWLAFAVDGTRIEAPRTRANEEVLKCAGRKKTGPQVYATVLYHMGLGLPWDLRVGPGTDSERRHLDEMLESLPPESLLVADAGFFSYELARRMNDGDRAFLLRVGGNTRLLTELGYQYDRRGDVVYVWPEKRQRTEPPVVLRLVRLRGKPEVYLLTNVLDRKALKDKDAAVLYKMRWGEEVFFRSYKQTMEHHRLKSRTPETALAEAAWAFMGLWLLGLMTIREQVARGVDPLEWSAAQARDAVRHAMREVPPRRRRRRESLPQRLARARRDRYTRGRPKTSRDYPRKKREKPPGPPKIQPAESRQIERAQHFRPQLLHAP
jgi:Transposase DDE domain